MMDIHQRIVVKLCILLLACFGLISDARGDLVAHWPLDEDFDNLANDQFDGYLVDTPVPAIVDFVPVELNPDGYGPAQDFAADFIGANSFVQTDYPGISGNNPRSITFWVKTGRVGANDFFGYGRPADGLKWHTRVNAAAANGLVGAVRTEYQGGQNVGTTRIDDGEWHHIAVVFPEGATMGHQIEHYVDAALQGTTGLDRAITTTLDPLYNVTIGLTRQSTTSLRNYVGQMADVRVYDHGLSPNDIFDLAGLEPPAECTTLAVTCDVNEELGSVTAFLTSSPADCVCSPVQVSVGERPLGNKGVSPEGEVALTIDEICFGVPGQDVELTFTCPDSDAVDVCELSCPARKGLVGHWQLNEGEGEFFEDSVGEFDGYLDPISTIAWVDGPPTQEFAVDFSGVDSWIQTDFPGIALSNPRTIACWIKTTTTGNHGIVSWGADVAGEKWHIRLNNTAGNGPLQGLRTEINGGYTIGTTPLADGEWHHIAVVVPEGATLVSDIIHYVDGVLEERGAVLDRTFSTRTLGANVRNVGFGRRVPGNGIANYFPGSIADVRIYDEAITEDDLLQVVTGGKCFASRTLSTRRYAPGDRVTVSIETANVGAGTTLTETLPDGWTVSANPNGGTVDGNSISFALDADAELSFELTIPEDYCDLAEFSGTLSDGGDCSSELRGPSSISCVSGCGELLASGGVREMLIIGPIDAGRMTNGSGQCDDQDPVDFTTFDQRDYLTDGDISEEDIAVVFGDEITPDFGGGAGGVGVADSPNLDINPNRADGVLTVWLASADGNGLINFNAADNIGDPIDDYIVYSLVYLDNTTGDELPVVLEVGSDDGVKVLVNGELAWVNTACRGVPAIGTGDRVILDGVANPMLEPGINTILIGIVERGGGTGVRLIVRDEFDAPLVDGSVRSCLGPGDQSRPENCSNGVDDDGDGLIDCADDDCSEAENCTGSQFVRGDVDGSGVINLSDGINLLLFQFQGGTAPQCLDAADTDDSGTHNLTDAIIIFQFLFLGGNPPASPTPDAAQYTAIACGLDPTDDDAFDCAMSGPICSQ